MRTIASRAGALGRNWRPAAVRAGRTCCVAGWRARAVFWAEAAAAHSTLTLAMHSPRPHVQATASTEKGSNYNNDRAMLLSLPFQTVEPGHSTLPTAQVQPLGHLPDRQCRFPA